LKLSGLVNPGQRKAILFISEGGLFHDPQMKALANQRKAEIPTGASGGKVLHPPSASVGDFSL